MTVKRSITYISFKNYLYPEFVLVQVNFEKEKSNALDFSLIGCTVTILLVEDRLK